MSAVWCVKCNFNTMILRKAHDNLLRCIRETPELRQASQGHRSCYTSNMIVKRLQLTHEARSPRHSSQAYDRRQSMNRRWHRQ